MFSTRGVTDHINRTAYDEADYCHSNAFSTLFFVISMAAVIEAIKVSLRGGAERNALFMRFSPCKSLILCLISYIGIYGWDMQKRLLGLRAYYEIAFIVPGNT